MAYHPKPVENYTNPFLATAGVLLFMALVALWAIYGYGASLFAAVVLLLAILRIPQKTPDYCPAQTRDAASRAPPP